MDKTQLPIPQLFFCKKCKVYFFTHSKLKHPTHSKCFSHKTVKATKEELEQINKTNGTKFVYGDNK